MLSLKTKRKTIKALTLEIDEVARAIFHMRGVMPFYGNSVQKVKTYFVLGPITCPTDALLNRLARWRAYLDAVAREYPHTAAYVDAELYRFDVIETAIRLLES